MDPIIEFNMSPEEILAYKVSLIWNEKSRQFFPDYSHSKIKSGDPRKSLIFKISYKLCRERAGLLLEEDYPLYIHAQLDILRHLSSGDIKPIISPNCLVGEKAWKRWKLWKKKYENIKIQKTMPIKAASAKIIDALEKTKEFLNSKQLDKKDIITFINLGKISPYYVVLSPYINNIFSKEDLLKLNFDFQLYKYCIIPEIEEYFKRTFPHEFK